MPPVALAPARVSVIRPRVTRGFVSCILVYLCSGAAVRAIVLWGRCAGE